MPPTLACLIFILITLFLASCNRNEVDPTPTAITQLVSPLPNRQASSLATPIPIAQVPTLTPIPLPTVTPSPIPQHSTPLPFPGFYDMGISGGEATPIPSTPLVLCTREGNFFHCYDELLDMAFRYPTYMGQLQYTTLRQGGYSGYVYEYNFENSEITAGGRSHDFSEGREPIFTDAKGFEGRSADEICAGGSSRTCTVYNSRIFLDVLLPQPEWNCGIGYTMTIFPHGSVNIDLPTHALINGFIFWFPLLSSEAQATFQDQWFSADACDPETQEAMRSKMAQLEQELLTGTADPEIQQRYNALLNLAQSIESPYLSTEP